MTKQIFFIDSAVPDSEVILASLAPDAIYYFLDDTHDGLQQMADILATYSELDAIQLISHGSAGSLQLGNSQITLSTLDAHSDALNTIGHALTATGDLLLYGCNVAQGDVGQAFIQKLAVATGADVAASTDLTGAAALGGNWVLEASAGEIQVNTLNVSNLTFDAVLPTVDLRLETTGIAVGNNAAEIVSIARANVGHEWSDNGCAAFVWGVTNLAGLPFFDLTAHLVGGATGDPTDLNDQDAYAVPHTTGVGIGIGPNAPGDSWALVSSSNSVAELKNVLRAGDVVRVYKDGNTTEDSTTNPWGHSFIVTANDGNGNVSVVDNWISPTHSIAEHSFDVIADSWAAGGNFQSAFVSRIDID
jgi:hypothetical protein